jgi:hypothetical protein
MSLADALLLERCPLDVWIALRTDGAKGSGTENDPYNGAPRYETALAVSSLSVPDPAKPREAAANVTAHGYANGAVVTVSGASGADGAFYSGTFVIYGVTANAFKYWMSGSPAGAASGTIRCAATSYGFDDALAAAAANTAVHVGPGTFLTRGYRQGGNPTIKSGQKIIGSGIGVTTIKLVNTSIVNGVYAVLGCSPMGAGLVGLEVRDLTLDCNLEGQLIQDRDFPPVVCAGILASGAHLHYRRVRVIHFGSLNGGECFVLWSAGARPGTAESVDCAIEDCIVEQPAINQHGMSTCLHMGYGEGPNGTLAYPRACVIRNSVVDCEYREYPIPIESISAPDGNGVATVTTRVEHGLSAGQWIRIGGALVAGAAHNGSDNGYNGSYPVNTVNPGGNLRQFTYVPTNPVPSVTPSGDMWVGRFPSHLVALSGYLQKSQTGPNEWTITLTTATAHYRVPGGNVSVEGVLTGTAQNPVRSPVYNGSFKVEGVTPWNPKILRYKVTSDPGPHVGGGFIGVVHQGMSNEGTSAVVEGNRVLNTRIGGPYHDTYSSRDSVVRNNYYRNVVTGPYQYMVGQTSAPIPVASVTHNGLTAILTTAVPHGLTPGQAVSITGVKVNNGQVPPEHSYNDPYLISTVPSSTQFTYQMGVNPGANADDDTGQVIALSQVERCVIENNVIELVPTYMSWGAPVAIALHAAIKHEKLVTLSAARVFRQLVVRNNVIRNMDGLPDSVAVSRAQGISVILAENALIESNVIDVPQANPIAFSKCTNVRFFNNRNSTGGLIPGVTGSAKQDELSTVIEDAALLAFI